MREPGLSQLSNHRSERPHSPEIGYLMFTQSEVEQLITMSVQRGGWAGSVLIAVGQHQFHGGTLVARSHGGSPVLLSQEMRCDVPSRSGRFRSPNRLEEGNQFLGDGLGCDERGKVPDVR